MSILKLPHELIDEILYLAALCRDEEPKIKRSMRMRLVCKYFAEAVYPALFRTHRLDHAIHTPSDVNCYPTLRYKQNRYGVKELWHRYLVYRVTCEKDPTVGRFVEVRDLAKILCETHAAPLGYQHVIETLCRLALDNVERGPFVFWDWGPSKWNVHRPNTNILNPLIEDVTPDPGLNLLAAAVRLDMPSLVKQILADGHDSAKYNFLFPPALQVAAECGNEGLLRLLLEARGTTRGSWRGGMDPGAFFGAAVAGRLDLLELVVAHAASTCPEEERDPRYVHGEVVSTREWKTHLIIHSLAATESPEVYEYISQNWVRHDRSRLYHHHQAFISHAGRGNLAMARWLLETKGLNPDSQSFQYPWHTALGEACRQGHADLVDYLLARGADPARPRSEDEGGHEFTPMWGAVRGNHTSLVRRLLAHGGVDLESPRSDRLVSEAFLKENAEVVRLLVERGAPLDKVAPGVARELVGLGCESMLDLLQSYGFQPEFDDKGELIKYQWAATSRNESA
ncbi:ankyrin repeat-containing domain protein [Apiospora arundinis]|uniref:Ankyrin repeat-containing domain protein n=1 Tax=Apiospora arundinis TaxID=335852 RepID=A0ABR2JG88_9PEZI